MGVFGTEPDAPTVADMPPVGAPSTESQDGESQPDVASTSERPSAEDYTTQGRTVVKMRPGYRHVPSDTSLPEIDSRGVQMNKEQAEKVVAESRGRAFIVEPDEKEGD
jgi:hypothetical protein